MIRYPCLLLIILSSFGLSAQDEQVPAREPVSAGICFFIDHTDRELAGDPADAGIYETRGGRSHRIGHTTGIDLLVPLGPRLALLTGIRFSDKGFRSRQPVEQFDAPPDTVGGGDLTTAYHLEYLELPLIVRLRFGGARLRPVVHAGVNGAFLLGSHIAWYNEIPEGRNARERPAYAGLEKLNVFPTAGIGLHHRTTDRIAIRLDLEAAYGVLPITNAPVRAHVWNVGLGFGVLYSLRGS